MVWRSGIPNRLTDQERLMLVSEEGRIKAIVGNKRDTNWECDSV